MRFAQKAAFYSSPPGKMRLLAHLPHLFKLYWRVFTDRRVSVLPKLVLLAGVLYFIIPLDLIPDFPFVGLGQLDDIALFILAARLFIGLAPRSVVEEHVRLIDEGV